MFERIKKALLQTRKIVIISNNKIFSKEIGFLFLFWNLLAVFWLSFVTIKYFQYRQVIINKNLEITKLLLVNNNLKRDLKILGFNINNVKQYLQSLNKYERFSSIELDKKNVFVFRLNEESSEAEYSPSLKSILDRNETDINDINFALVRRIKGIEGFIQNTGLDLGNVHKTALLSKDYNDIDFEKAESLKIQSGFLFVKSTDYINNNLSYLNYLEDFVDKIPLHPPVSNYHVTSGFGVRRDPFTRKYKLHKGVDMAAPINAKIHVPSDGKVIFVGSRGGFGKTVEIDHGNGIVTEYAHLKRIFVNKNQKVKRGQVLGVQGNTGKSTGQHLHYEIRYKGRPFDPDNFIKTGNTVF